MVKEFLNEEFVKEHAMETTDIKGYTLYFVRIECYQGLCCLAFKNGHYITEDLAIWHKPYEGDIPKEKELHDKYLENMQTKLYTEEELQTVKDYDDYTEKSYFLNNYYGNEIDHLSWFGIEHATGIYDMDVNMEEKKMIYTINNPVAFCYNKLEHKEFVEHMIKLKKTLENAKKNSEQSEEYMLKAFEYEMDNHEYAINWQGDWDVCSCFGNCKYSDDKDYTDYLKEIGKENLISVYAKAKKNHMKRAANW